jgi:hypothetical protein
VKISGFTMARNAAKLYYPIRESIASILPIVDEFVVALGDCDEDDRTLQEIEGIGSPKIRVIRTTWDLERYPRGMENAHQTDLAKEQCSGDWLFYLQADEVVHEKYHDVIVARCEELLEDREVEGLLFKYIHFWGDYDHYVAGHAWYQSEIRIIRNDKDIHSWESAQSFRRIPRFDHTNYRQQEGTHKLKVATVDAYVYHYGWVRPPELMQGKVEALDAIHKGPAAAAEMYEDASRDYDYGPLGRARKFKGTHPAVMKQRVDGIHWKDRLNYARAFPISVGSRHKHDRLKYRLLTFLERNLLGGRPIFTFRNYILLKNK